MKLKLPFAICAWCICIGMLFGQKVLGRINLLNGEKGLSQTSNAFIYKDSKGYVWLSSTDGLNCYNGSTIKVYKPDKENKNAIYDANVQSPFFEDEVGNIWFSTVSSLNCFQHSCGKFAHYVLNENNQLKGPSTNYAFYLEQGRYLWITAFDSLYKFDTKHLESTIGQHALIASRCAVQSGTNGKVKRLFACFWVMKQGFEMISYNENGNILNRDTFFTENYKPAPFTLTISQVIPESDSLVWFATDQGLLAFNPLSPGKFRLFSPPGEAPGLRNIYRQKSGLIWVITDKGLIFNFDKKLMFSGPLSDWAGQIVTDAQTMLIDEENTVWYSVFGSGVSFSKLISKQFRQIAYPGNNLKSEINALFEDKKGNLFCTGKQGTSFIIKADGHIENGVQFPARSRFYQDTENKIWNISSEGLGYWNESEAKVVNILSLKGVRMNDITEWENGYLIIGTAQKTIKLSKKDFSIQYLPMLPYGILDLYIDHTNRLWTGGINDDLSLWKINQNETPVLIHKVFNSSLVHHLTEDIKNNCMWAATANGLLRVDLNSLKDTLITEKEGLPNQYIYSIVLDKKGSLWLSTNQGIVKYMPYMPIGQQFKHYTTLNGLSANEYKIGAGLFSINGEIWFGSTKGLDVFNPNSVHDLGAPPKLNITGLKVHDRAWPWDTTATTCIEMANQITLKHNENTLRLELAAMEYTDPEMNKFRVWLSRDGNKPDTVELGTQNFITYANLRPGHYRFGFTACNSEGIWQETPRNLDIFIRPHFTQTWWFPWLVGAFSLAFIGFGTAFYYRYRLRLQQLALEKQQREAERKQLLLENELALQEERNRIADEMHDELGGGLSTIRLASQRAKKVQSSEELQSILKRVSQISIGLVNNMRGIIWAMDSQNDSLRSLLAYIRQYAGTFLDDNGIAASLSLPGDFPDRALSSQFRHNIMLTVKECLNNILKHADATEVVLSSSVNGQLQITIRDNGKGFDPIEQSGMGKGLRTTVKRMESVGGSIAWQRNNEGGMTVTLLAPLP